MKFFTFLKKQMTLVFVVGVLLSLTSCGSFQYSGIYDDGIYSDSEPAKEVTETADNTSYSSDYYENYFKEKSLQIEEDNTVFTDVDSYQGAYEDDSENTNNYAGWGENNSSEIIINVYDNGPYYGSEWGYNYRNNWGWNFGWNNWGYSFWQPNYYNSWYNPYCYYGCYNNYGYYNSGYNRFRGRSYSYINGQRRSAYRNSSLSSRSVLSAATRNRVSRSNLRSTTRTTRSTTRPNSRSTTRSTRSITRPTNTRPTRSNSTTRPTTRPNTTNRSTRSSTRSSTSSTTRSRSSSTIRSSRSSGSSRRKNN